MNSMNALLLSLPTRNSTVRMRVWRALKDTGCGVLRDGVYVLPAGAAGGSVLDEMQSEITAAGGFAMTVEMKLKSQQLEQVRKLFDRSAEYGALVSEVKAAKSNLPRLGQRKAQTALHRLQRSFDRLTELDFFPGQANAQAAEAVSGLKQSFQEVYSHGEPRASKKRLRRLDSSKYQKRIWATRRDPWVDRLASAWLIKRFIDPDAAFKFVPGKSYRPKTGELRFDMYQAEYTHEGERCTFETLLARFDLATDPALEAIAEIVHDIDLKDEKFGRPEAPGVAAVLAGLTRATASDADRVRQGSAIFDGLHAQLGGASG